MIAWDTKSTIILFACGVFLVYLAAFDDTLVDALMGNGDRNQVVLATLIAAGLPMFFAVGFFKQTVLTRWLTIYPYEVLVGSVAFWILSAIVLIVVIAIKLSNYLGTIDIPIVIISMLFVVYLIYISINHR